MNNQPISRITAPVIPVAGAADTSPVGQFPTAPTGDFYDTITVEYAWPHKNLHSNGRGNHAYRGRLTKEARSLAAQTTWDAGLHPMTDVLPDVVTFCPPNKNKRDRANLPFAAKSILDGIADALGVDDVSFDPKWDHGEVKKRGAIVVTFKPIPAS